MPPGMPVTPWSGSSPSTACRSTFEKARRSTATLEHRASSGPSDSAQHHGFPRGLGHLASTSLPPMATGDDPFAPLVAGLVGNSLATRPNRRPSCARRVVTSEATEVTGSTDSRVRTRFACSCCQSDRNLCFGLAHRGVLRPRRRRATTDQQTEEASRVPSRYAAASARHRASRRAARDRWLRSLSGSMSARRLRLRRVTGHGMGRPVYRGSNCSLA